LNFNLSLLVVELLELVLATFKVCIKSSNLILDSSERSLLQRKLCISDFKLSLSLGERLLLRLDNLKYFRVIVDSTCPKTN
jgi:hypothetical protein